MYVVLFPGLVLWNVTGRYLANYAVMLTLRSIYTDKFLAHSDFLFVVLHEEIEALYFQHVTMSPKY